MKITRRKMLNNILISASAAFGATAIDAFAVEPNIVIVRRIALPLNGLPKPFAGKTIAQISDLHLGSSTSQRFLLKAIEKLNSLNPDFVFLTGDYTTRYDKDDYFDDLCPVFAALKSNYGIFACLGNHDYGLNYHTYQSVIKRTSDCLAENSITLLRNSSDVLEIEGERIYIIGLGDYTRRDCRPQQAFNNLDEGFLRLIIAHSPDCIGMCEDFDYDAFLCGHTHGGQVCLPFLGPIIVPSEDKRFKKGLYSHNGKFVYVNSGLATLPSSLPGPRFLCPPEITLYTLTDYCPKAS